MGTFDFIGNIKKINPQADQYADVDKYIDTGSYILNALLSGSIYKGLPGNKVTALAGESATGKTYFLLGMIRQFLEDHKKGGVIFFESESAISKSMLEDRGIDTSRIKMLPVATVEQFRTQAMTILKAVEDSPPSERIPLLFCLDSLGQLSTTKEVEDVASGSEKRDMTRAPMIKGAFRVLTIQLGKLGIPMVVTNHTYDKIGSLYPTKELAGGSGLKYSADSIVFLSKKKEKEGTEVVGNIVHCRNYKSRLTVENKLVDVLLRYDTGLNRYYGLIELGLLHGTFKSVSNRIEFPDGTKVFAKHINEDPEKYFTKEILDQLDAAARKEYLYGMNEEGTEDGSGE
ncbi:MAG: recombinase RecA [Bacteroidetes bacterium]|nr:recombinase RecA [Bacteroidota bacterium]